jgi:alpha-1,6-mannosyltransferase
LTATAAASVRPWIARRAPEVALAAGAGTLALLAAAVGFALPESSPLSPDHAGGDSSWAWVYLAAMSGAFVFYVGGLAVLSRRGARLGAVVALGVAIQLLPLVGPVLLSTDVYTYWARGRVGTIHEADPYTTPPSAFPQDPAIPRMGASWRERPTGYGPAFTLLSEGHALVAGDRPGTAAYLYRVLAAASMLALIGLAVALASEKAFAAAFVGWNPLLAVQFAGGGHNDALMMALVLGALVLAARRRTALAGACWAASIAVKWVSLVFLPLRAVEAYRQGRKVSHVGFAVALGLIAAAAFWRYGPDWLESFGNFSGQLRRTTSVSTARWLEAIGLSEDAAVAVLTVLFVAGYLWLLRGAWRGRARLALCACFLLLTASWLVPWYAVWAVPLAAIERDRTAQVLSLVICAYLLRAAVPL